MSETTITATFEITGWDAETYDESAGGPKLARTTVRKTFSGPLTGTSVAELLTAERGDGRGYVASERVTGTLDGRSGTFVLQHGGVGDATGQHAFGHVVPGTATGALEGLRGTVVYAHDDDGARATLTYILG
jgi:Protein of unknown function (DUF3224)